MNIVTKIDEWLAIRYQLRNKTIGFIPTMGYLHAGHVSLCERSKAENEITVASIFVNPTQFNQSQDFELYPRNLAADSKLLAANNVDYLFAPDAHAMYPDQFEMRVSETIISQDLEGEFRPGHFNGMLTIVLKFLNLIQPTRAYFGEKDYQQLLLVKKMVSALFIPTEIIGCETMRAEDGLALSSRNARLSEAMRKHAAHFPRLLNSELKPEEISKELELLGFTVEYVVDRWDRRLAAVFLDEIRLIDNIPLNK